MAAFELWQEETIHKKAAQSWTYPVPISGGLLITGRTLQDKVLGINETSGVAKAHRKVDILPAAAQLKHVILGCESLCQKCQVGRSIF